MLDLARAVYIRFRGKALRYSSVSAIGVVTGTSLLLLALDGFGWEPVVANLFSVTVSSVPAYLLNRAWVWGKTSRHSFTREVLPFWGMALAGLVWSTLLVWAVQQWTEDSAVVALTNLAAFGSLWLVKFMVLDAVLFRHDQHHAEPVG